MCLGTVSPTHTPKSYVNLAAIIHQYDFYPGIKEIVLVDGRENNDLPEVHFLTLTTCDYVELHSKGKTKTANGIKVANPLTLKWGDYPGLSGPNLIRDP